MAVGAAMVSEHNQGTICKDRSWVLLNCVFWGKNQTDFQAQEAHLHVTEKPVRLEPCLSFF